MQPNAADRYFAALLGQFQTIRSTQAQALETGAAWIAEAIAGDHLLYAFGSGHSHVMAEEIFFRAGGLVRAVPILDPPLMLHGGAQASTQLERREGYAAGVLDRYSVGAGDVVLVVSNSGRNAVPIELALLSQARGARTIAISNPRQSRELGSRHSSGRTLPEVADLVIDNACVIGDACLDLPGMPSKVGPTSTLTGALIVNLMTVRAMELLVERGTPAEIFISSNAGGEAHNQLVLARLAGRLQHL